MKSMLVEFARHWGFYHSARRLKLWLYKFLPTRMRDDADAIAFLSRFIQPNDLVFDVGANVGIKTKTFRGLGARVVAVEPQIRVLAELSNVFKGDQDVQIVPKALSSTIGLAEFYEAVSHSGLSTMSASWRNRGRFAQTESWRPPRLVETTTLDCLIREFGVPRFCKIDVEGFEHEVLKGLTQPIEFISFEFHGELVEVAIDCIHYLSQLGLYEFNIVLSSGERFEDAEWQSHRDISRRLRELGREAEGEMYARLNNRVE